MEETFDNWMRREYAYLRNVITERGFLNEDAFQDAYLNIRQKVRFSVLSDKVHLSNFLIEYKRISKSYINGCYSNKENGETILQLISMPNESHNEAFKEKKETLAHNIRIYIRTHFSPLQALTFDNVFIRNMSITDACMVAGCTYNKYKADMDSIMNCVRTTFNNTLAWN